MSLFKTLDTRSLAKIKKTRILTNSFIALLGISAIAIAACSTVPMSESEMNAQNQRHTIRHTIRELAEYDNIKMISLMNKEFNSNISDDKKYLIQAVTVFGQTILVQPHFTEREATVREFKSKIEQNEYLDLIPQTAEQLISISESENPADQASAIFALTNLVVEIRSIYKSEREFQPELKALLFRIRDSHIKVKDSAQRYAHEQVSELVSPSEEANLTLKTLLEPNVVAEK